MDAPAQEFWQYEETNEELEKDEGDSDWRGRCKSTHSCQWEPKQIEKDWRESIGNTYSELNKELSPNNLYSETPLGVWQVMDRWLDSKQTKYGFFRKY